MDTPSALELRDASKRYGNVVALDHVSFTVRPGESVGYLGPNGAGKSTTLKLLAGLTHPTGGTVLLRGVDPVTDRRSSLSSVGILVETPGVLPYITGADLLLHIAEVKGIPSTDRRAAVRTAAASMDVESSLDRKLGSLSTGLLRRMQLSGALIGDPKVLILDEPTLGLDPAARADLRVVLRRISHDGRTVLLSTHLLEDVEEVCQRVLFLRSGKLVGDESVSGGGPSANADRARTLRVTLVGSSKVEDLQKLLGDRGTVETPGDQRMVIRFRGGLEEQSEIVRRLAAGGVSVASAELVGSDLASRYLAKVGREDAA